MLNSSSLILCNVCIEFMGRVKYCHPNQPHPKKKLSAKQDPTYKTKGLRIGNPTTDTQSKSPFGQT